MKTYINRRPPWGWPRPEYRLYVVLTNAEAERVEGDNLLMRRELYDHADKALTKHAWAACVPFYNARGKLLKVINREK